MSARAISLIASIAGAIAGAIAARHRGAPGPVKQVMPD